MKVLRILGTLHRSPSGLQRNKLQSTRAQPTVFWRILRVTTLEKNADDLHGLGAFLIMNEQRITSRSTVQLIPWVTCSDNDFGVHTGDRIVVRGSNIAAPAWDDW